MSRGSKSVFLACAFGGGIGALVAHSFGRWFWLVGLIVGFLIGYILYDARAAARAVPAALRAAWTWGWSSQILKWLFWAALIVLTVFIWPPLIAVLYCGVRWIAVSRALIETASILGLFLAISALFTVCLTLQLLTRNNNTEDRRAVVQDLQRVLYWTAPPTVLFWHLPRGIFFTTRAIACFARHFGWALFVRIHSEQRLLCGCDAMFGAVFGAAIGHIAHLNPALTTLAGTVIGGLLGLVNYELITERWLKPKGYCPTQSA